MAARVTSADGTEIAFERAGDGPAVISGDTLPYALARFFDR